MKFFSGLIRKYILEYAFLALILLLLGGCGQVVIKPRSVTGQAMNSVENEPSQMSNPYLENLPAVPMAAKALFKKANAAMEAKQWGQAEVVLQQLISDYPKLSGPYLNLGIVYLQTGRSDNDVEQQFSKAVTVNPNNLEAYNRLANVKRRQGQFREAESIYQQALGLWSQHPASHLNLAILYDLYLNDLANAKRHYEIYQNLLAEPDRQVAGWLVDIRRRLKAIEQKTIAKTESQGVAQP